MRPRAAHNVSVAGRISSPVFVGRQGELADIRAAFERAARGQAAAVLVVGEAGIGKSRIVAEFAAHAEGARVLTGTCFELAEGALPYAPWIQAFRPIAREIDSGGLPGPDGSLDALLAPSLPIATASAAGASEEGDPSARARFFELFLRLLERIGRDSPVVVVLEDLHWSDASTRDLLRFLCGNLRTERVLLLLTARSDELAIGRPLSRFFTDFVRLPTCETIELAPFTRHELATCLAAILGAPPSEELLDEIARRSTGNVLFAQELLAARTSTARHRAVHARCPAPSEGP